MPPPDQPADPPAPEALEGGTYEVLRRRLLGHGEELRARLDGLDASRREVFGAVEPRLVATERISTDYNCVARDIAAVGGDLLLFGYNVQMGLKTVTEVEDVFGLYRYESEAHHFAAETDGPLADPGFREDFAMLYRYYRETRFAKFMVAGPHLFMAFRVGKAVEDVKCFKWLLKGDGTLDYLGNRSDHEYRFPPQQDFEWTRAHRGMYREGLHPHVSIEDRVFVETVGGDLTVKLEDNTASGEGIYAEAVSHSDQTLDDAEIFYACVGSLILLKILPYQEKLYRHLVYNEKTRSVTRVDSIGNSCVLLPEDHGIIFSDGYYLQTGELKLFPSELSDMLFERRVASPNGEDHLYAFYNRLTGHYILMAYNLIRQSVENPIVCNGYTLFEDGELAYFRGRDEPQKHHAVQIWQTPFSREEQVAPGQRDHFLYKVGNADLVKCLSEGHEILGLLQKEDSYADLYLDLSRRAGDLVDTYFWAGEEGAHRLRETLLELKAAADAAISEFEKVAALRTATGERMRETGGRAEEAARRARGLRPDDIFGFVESLGDLRALRGEVISLRELRYHDAGRIDRWEAEIVEASERLSADCVAFLLGDRAMEPYRRRLAEQEEALARVQRATEADQVGEALAAAGAELEMLVEVVGNLRIADATETTRIIDEISAIYAALNGVRARLRNRRQELARLEGEAQFGAQLQLLSQSVTNFLDLCDTPEKCDDYLARTMIQLEDLEGRFSDFDDYLVQLVEKRDEIHNAFESRKVQLLERRNQRSAALHRSAGRLLATVQHRLDQLQEVSEINGYLAGDLMVEKVRDIIAELGELGDTVRSDDIRTRLKTLRDDAVRQLRDRKDLYVDGQNVIRLGRHHFSVNRQELELSIVPHHGGPAFHLAGTEFFEPVRDEILIAAGPLAEMGVVSENAGVYRAEFLSWKFLASLAEAGREAWGGLAEEERGRRLQVFIADRYEEGYTRGVHDEDALKLLDALVGIDRGIGLLRYHPRERILARLAWETAPSAWREDLEARAAALAALRRRFPGSRQAPALMEALEARAADFLKEESAAPRLFPDASAKRAAAYWYEQLVSGEPLVADPDAAAAYEAFSRELTAQRLAKPFAEALRPLAERPALALEMALEWYATVEAGGADADVDADADGGDGDRSDRSDEPALALEAAAIAALAAAGGYEHRGVRHAERRRRVEGLQGQHPRVREGALALDFVEFSERLARYEEETVPAYLAYRQRRVELVETRRETLRLEEFKPKVLSSFVRNRLLDKVFLPLIGDNLAKQMGTAGDETRTDRSGMLLLISPPGYGKTTIMEYVANRLGITFMKINGPALGHEVTSLDPEDAPNASAREEIQKLNLAFEMGDNVMIYVDDIQHTHPEFLQKFISLCDAQRRIEGVWNGRPRTYDLRGKKACVIMAGNPYTESGGKFRIPDMLANRADTYNLGDIVGGHRVDFELSYIENSVTSNPVLSRLSGGPQSDVHALAEAARSGAREGLELEAAHSPQEIDEMLSVIAKLLRVRDTILRVNLEYIRSAAMEDAYRTEPPFRLQGSYRNMNRIAERVLPVMTAAEVDALVVSHYENEAQTLTTGAEANLLKFRELEGILGEEEAARWTEIKRRFGRNLLMGSQNEDDPLGRVVGTLATFGEGLHRVEGAIAAAAETGARPATLADDAVEKMRGIIEGLRAVPVHVEIKVVPVQESGEPAEIAEEELPVAIESKVAQGEESEKGEGKEKKRGKKDAESSGG